MTATVDERQLRADVEDLVQRDHGERCGRALTWQECPPDPGGRCYAAPSAAVRAFLEGAPIAPDVERLMVALEAGHKRDGYDAWADRAGLRRFADQIAADYGAESE